MIRRTTERPNEEIRRKIADSGLFSYEVAQQLGVTSGTLCAWLRNELSPERHKQIEQAIYDAAAKLAR